tara:strand:- start:2228 stop:2659 length:432 start_codon:yes stop_codon:yes gene_type:complete
MIIMTEKYKIIAKYIKDMSSETPNLETYLFVKDRIKNYSLTIDIQSKALKNKHVEVDTTLKFEDKDNNEKKSYFEMIFSSIVKINENVNEKKEIQKIILSDVQVEIYPELENAFENMLNNSGYPDMKIEKKIDFEKLYNNRFN